MNYTFLHSKRRLSESASLNVIRQLLLFSVAKTDKLPLLYSIILRSRIMIYKSAFERLKGVKRITTFGGCADLNLHRCNTFLILYLILFQNAFSQLTIFITNINPYIIPAIFLRHLQSSTRPRKRVQNSITFIAPAEYMVFC